MNTSHLTSPALLHISHHIMNAYTHAFVVAYFDGLLPPSPKHTLFCTLQKPIVGPNELLYFGDICAGPGGFSEYVLWRRKGDCKGFGLTLRGENDFKLEDFFAGPSEMFEPHYGKFTWLWTSLLVRDQI